MPLLRQLRWKLFVSHALVIIVGVAVFLPTAWFLASNPVLSGSGGFPETGAGVAAGAPLTFQDRFRSVVGDALLVAAFAALAAAIVVSLYVSQRVVEPLQELTAVSGRLAQGYYSERTTLQSDDEFAMLSQSINQLAGALEQTEQRRLGLLADVAHELRTPLSTIEGYMEGLVDEVIKPEPRIFAMVHHEATRLKWMIQEMALLSRAEAGQITIDARPMTLAPLVEQVVDQFVPQSNAQDINLVLHIAPELPDVLADRDRVEQVLINLIANAVQYTPGGGTINIGVEMHAAQVRVSVRDTGIGIAAAHLAHVFERFYRVDKSRNRKTGGAGIGLTIARHLVYAMGGEIWVESEGEGRGATFNFTLPAHEPAQAGGG